MGVSGGGGSHPTTLLQFRKWAMSAFPQAFGTFVLQTFIAFRLGSARLWSKLPWGSGSGGLRACTPRI